MCNTPDISEVREILIRYFPPPDHAVFLFGSRASGEHRRASDWDIGIWSKRPISGREMVKAREDLEALRTLHSFDLVDFAKVSREFRNVALSKIKVLSGEVPDDRE